MGRATSTRLPSRGDDAGQLLLQHTPQDRLAVERMAFGPGITGPVALACFYLMGGALTLLALVVPGFDADLSAVLAVGLAASVSGALVLALRSLLSTASCHVLVALGSVLIGAAMVAGAGGPGTAGFSVFFVWVGVYGAVFFAPRAAALQLVWAGTVHVVALALASDDAAVAAQTVVLFGTVAATALVVGALVRQIRVVAATDALTGLANRRSFDEHVHRELARATRTGRPLALLALDLDGFKQINDSHGHAAGDRLLVEAGRAWAGVLRDGEMLARSGGDEFVVLLPETDAAGAARVAARLAAATPSPLGVSIGRAVSEPEEDPDALLRRADRDLYRAKALTRPAG